MRFLLEPHDEKRESYQGLRMVDVFLELIQLMPKKVQWVVAAMIAGLLITFLAYLVYLYFSGKLW